MKKYFVFAAFTLITASLSWAADCVDENGKDILDDPATFQKLIGEKKTCSEATDLARACAWGSSMDISTAGAAEEVCRNEYATYKPSKEDDKLMEDMVNRCITRYKDEDGTLYKAILSYCRLDAVAWLTGIVNPEQ